MKLISWFCPVSLINDNEMRNIKFLSSPCVYEYCELWYGYGTGTIKAILLPFSRPLD